MLAGRADYCAPMLLSAGPAAPVAVRAVAISVASVLLGVVAHGSVSGVAPSAGSVLVIAVFLAQVVLAPLMVGQAAGRVCSRRGWSVPVEDGAAVVALVLGQAVVHWLAAPMAAPLAVGSAAHGHAHGPTPLGHVGHGGSPGGQSMLLAHAAAAVAVALLLRRVEAGLLLLADLAPRLRAAVAGCHALLRPVAGAIVLAPRTCPAAGLCAVDVRPRLQVFLQPVDRRGPPAA